ncbi:serine/arginine repetitive matrix protein 2-like [Achroia grisella]|uniref:serine/arginine repetitive matrix protein 2-like n=1 Tax=Achroia grisella TaxID=688607 RepID=UPI0027D2F4C5|nr:serine/arginine repetitive matrix protein 2-like [Achroia grisella]
MSGGRLVVLDRQGRDVKRYPLPEGLATLGSDPACNIRVMLPSVCPHHATVVVHANQAVVRNVSTGETLVNGRGVSVAALRHGDTIALGGRRLRWEYDRPAAARPAPQPALPPPAARSAARGPRRRTAPAPPPPRDPALHLALEMRHRASMPASAGGKQVAIVQPQRRDTTELNDQHSTPRSYAQTNKRPRISNNELDTSVNSESDKSKRKSNARPSAKSPVANLQGTTKATLWIESRKTSPRKSVKLQTPVPATPLRMTVLKKAQSAQKIRVTKIQAPLKIDHTKQAAIMLMTGHTPKNLPSPKNAKKSPKTPTLLVKKSSPVRKTPRGSYNRISKETAGTPKNRMSVNRNTPNSTVSSSSIRSSRRTRNSPIDQSVLTSPLLPTPKKSALKDPSAKKSVRKTESIKFDLSNLENHNEDSEDVFMISDTTYSKHDTGSSYGEDDLTLRYSETPSIQSPSPRKSIHSRSSKILEKTLGTPTKISTSRNQSTLTPESPRTRKSSRGSLILQSALRSENLEPSTRYSQRTTKSLSDDSYNTTVASAFRTKTLSPRSPSRNNLESYSIVDLVSVDSTQSVNSSVYDSIRTTNSGTFGTPQSNVRKTRSTIDPAFLSSSTPYVEKPKRTSTSRSQSSPNISRSQSKNDSQSSTRSNRRSKSLTTPENAQTSIPVNSTRISRASRSRSRINDSDFLISSEDGTEMEDVSPKSSKRLSRPNKSQLFSPADKSTRKSTTNVSTRRSTKHSEGTSTPENRNSPEEAGTPVLSIQSLLDSSQSSLASQRSPKSRKKGRSSIIVKRKTIGVIPSGRKRGRPAPLSKSLSFGSRKLRTRLSKDSLANSYDKYEGPVNEEIVTPKSGVKLIQEAVKNKHSTAKKPQSKRSIIDDLNASDIVKQLFNSPVKRKLSQSMSEFSRKQLFDDDDDIVIVKRPTRNTVAITGRTPDNSLLEQTGSYSPEVFVSPLGTPNNSPNLTGIKRLFRKQTPDNDLRNVSGVKNLLRTPRTRQSVKNDLSQVTGVKRVFAKSPKNRLSDVAVKRVFAASPKNDLGRVSGVKSLFQSQRKNKSPRNDLSDVRGVKKLFSRNSPANNLTNVSGVKGALQKKSPKNDLTDVRGVRGIFRQRRQQRDDLNDVSGVEELFNLSNNSRKDADSLFDRLVGKPQIKAVYSKTFIKKDSKAKSRKSAAKSLHLSMDAITNNVEEWLQQELQNRLYKDKTPASNVTKSNLTRELQKLATDTVEGNSPFRQSRVRNSTITKSVTTQASDRKKSASELYSAHTLPIKKRSLVEVSIDKTRNESRSNVLPIKKRVVVHSTPVKGRNLTMNASELGRVSPIAAVETHVTSIQEPVIVGIKLPKGRRTTRTKLVESNVKVAKLSPKKPRVSEIIVKSPGVRTTRALRGNKNDNSQPTPKKQRVSLVITKKQPIPIPKSTTRKGKIGQKPVQASPKENPKKRITRQQKDETATSIVKTPKKTRAKVQKASVVVSKPSPQLKPRAANTRRKETKEAKVVSKTAQPETKRRMRNNEASVSDAIGNVENKGKRKKVESPKSSKAAEPLPRQSRATKGRQTNVGKSQPQLKNNKKVPNKPNAKKAEPQSKAVNTSAKTRGRKTVAIVEVKETKTRGKNIKSEEIATSKSKARGKNESLEKNKSRVKKSEPKPVVTPIKKGRGARKVNADTTISEVITTRKRKTTVEQDLPSKLRKTKSDDIAQSKAKGNKNVESKTSGRQKKAVANTSKDVSKGAGDGGKSKSRPARSRKAEQDASVTQKQEAKPTRGRKTASVVDNATQRGGRKRKLAAETPDKSLKESNKKQPPAKRSRKAEVAAVPRAVEGAGNTRRTRATQGRGGKR